MLVYRRCLRVPRLDTVPLGGKGRVKLMMATQIWYKGVCCAD